MYHMMKLINHNTKFKKEDILIECHSHFNFMKNMISEA